jgi:FixJ family two-component response regulator
MRRGDGRLLTLADTEMAQEINPGGEILILDDDAAVRAALSMVFSREGYRVQCFLDSHSFLAAARARIPACIILDVHIPGRSGLEVLKELNAESYPAPIFIISGRGDIPMAVDAIKHGAFDFVEKPFRGSDVVARVREAIEALARRQANNSVSDKYSFGLPSGAEPLTPRECEVLHQLVAGASNKEVGRQLGISPRTVEVHRARIMEKVGAKNIADLIRMVMTERPGS